MSKGIEVARILKDLNVFDISPTYETNMPGFRGHPAFWIIEEGRTYELHKFYAQMLVICEHHGSHVDAPAHLVKGMATIDQLPPDILIGPYKKYDFTRHNPEAGRNMTMKEIKEVEARDKFVPESGDIILLQFGWDKYYKPESTNPMERDWYGGNVPGIDEEVCKYFTEIGIRAIGSDAISTDNAYKNYEITYMPGHEKYFLPNNILIMEGFVNLVPAPPVGLFVAVPLKIKNGSGSPIRALLFG